MARFFVRLFTLLFLGVLITGCAAVKRYQDERLPRYDVREVAVLARGRVSPALIRGVDSRVSHAISATIRTQALPRVVLSVKIDKVVKGIGENRDRNEATFSVDVFAVDNGALLGNGMFKAISYSTSADTAELGLAEEIAARIRSAFDLMTPPLPRARNVMMTRPAAWAATAKAEYEAEQATTRQTDDTPAMQQVEMPQKAEAVEEVVTKPVVVSGPAVGEDLEGGAVGKISIKPAASTTTTEEVLPAETTATGAKPATP